jgi:hypothetical protein
LVTRRVSEGRTLSGGVPRSRFGLPFFPQSDCRMNGEEVGA